MLAQNATVVQVLDPMGVLDFERIPEVPMPFLILPMVFWMVILVGGFQLASRLVRAYEQRSAGGSNTGALQERVARLEESLESMNVQLNRLAEAQQFTTRLLEGRPGGAESSASTEPGSGSAAGGG
jgi:hypothetical protein